ncbi:MAG TPA: TfoX/Sxy family protein [Thermoanaerobaculia bacterium]|nr:TfoX/Sxy family protein [Thermoanaerobaculia bacterium]
MGGKTKRAMPKWTKAPEGLVAGFTKAAEAVPGAAVRQMFGYPAAFLSGNMFAGIFQSSVMLRLPEEARDELIENGGEPFEPIPGRIMKEYVVLPPQFVRSPRLLDGWLAKAASHARTLPPKAAATRKPTSRI